MGGGSYGFFKITIFAFIVGLRNLVSFSNVLLDAIVPNFIGIPYTELKLNIRSKPYKILRNKNCSNLFKKFGIFTLYQHKNKKLSQFSRFWVLKGFWAQKSGKSDDL